MMGSSCLVFSVAEYSTRTGTSRYSLLSTRPSDSISFSVWDSIGKPAASKAILLLSTASGQTDAAEAYFKQLTGFMGMQDCGVCKVVGGDNKKEEKMAEIQAWAATLK